MNKYNKEYYLVITKVNDKMQLPLYVAETLSECAEWLGCSVKTLYRYKRYADYKIDIVENKEDYEV